MFSRFLHLLSGGMVYIKENKPYLPEHNTHPISGSGNESDRCVRKNSGVLLLYHLRSPSEVLADRQQIPLSWFRVSQMQVSYVCRLPATAAFVFFHLRKEIPSDSQISQQSTCATVANGEVETRSENNGML